jgi:putative ABC transport system substrate-binding protein
MSVGAGTGLFLGTTAIVAAAVVAAVPWSARAGERPFVIIKSSDIDAYREAESGARDRLRGHPVIRYALDGDPDSIPDVAEQVSLLSPRGVVAIGSLAAAALKAHPVEAPVVFCLVIDHNPALKSVRHSWAISMHVPADEAYARIRHIVPEHRIGIPYDPDRSGWLVRDLASFFANTSMTLVPFVVRSSRDLGPALLAVRDRIDALWIVPDTSFLDAVSIKYLLRYSATEGLPLIGYSDGFTRSGAILSLAGDHRDMGRQAAELAERIAAGDAPARVQPPQRVRTLINLQVAARLGVAINPGVAALAERTYP